MNGKIDIVGRLMIDRPGAEDLMTECVENKGNGLPCSHSCPHFGEPYTRKVTRGGSVTMLNICQGNILEFENFKDERITR